MLFSVSCQGSPDNSGSQYAKYNHKFRGVIHRQESRDTHRAKIFETDAIVLYKGPESAGSYNNLL